jgi:hypothetical protein
MSSVNLYKKVILVYQNECRTENKKVTTFITKWNLRIQMFPKLFMFLCDLSFFFVWTDYTTFIVHTTCCAMHVLFCVNMSQCFYWSSCDRSAVFVHAYNRLIRFMFCWSNNVFVWRLKVTRKVLLLSCNEIAQNDNVPV